MLCVMVHRNCNNSLWQTLQQTVSPDRLGTYMAVLSKLCSVSRSPALQFAVEETQEEELAAAAEQEEDFVTAREVGML